MEQNEIVKLTDETLIINLPEELDHCSVGVLRKKTDALFSSKRVRNVIFNYEHTQFMDSSGIGLVMGRYREVRYLGGNIYIVGVNERIARILDISGLYKVAKRLETIGDALESIG